MSTHEATFYTRWTAQAGGPYPLRLKETSAGPEFELLRSGNPETFKTQKGLMAALGASHLHWTLDRYLGTGRFAPAAPVAEPGLILVGPLSPVQLESTPVRTTPSGITVFVPTVRGVDLVRRGHEVAKLLRAGFHGWIRSAGYDFEDVLQEVYRKILVANQGRSPWDPRKSSFGHYVHMVCRSALSNFHRKHSRITRAEQLGVRQGDGWVALGDSRNHIRDASQAVSRPQVDPVAELARYITTGPHRTRREAPLAATLVRYVWEGHTLKHTAVMLGVERSEVGRAMKLVRLCAAETLLA